MQKISPYNPVVIETARRFNEAHNGELLIEMIHDVEEHGDESPYHFIFNADDSLLEGAREAKVGMGANQVCYTGFLHYVSIAQAHILREGEEISSLNLQVLRNFSENDAPKARGKILEIGESLGDSENNLYNFLIDLFNQIYEIKKQALSSKLPLSDTVNDALREVNLEETLIHANLGLDEESLSDVLGLISWASDGPANEVEIREISDAVKND